jgi:hypothetical protein
MTIPRSLDMIQHLIGILFSAYGKGTPVQVVVSHRLIPNLVIAMQVLKLLLRTDCLDASAFSKTR